MFSRSGEFGFQSQSLPTFPISQGVFNPKKMSREDCQNPEFLTMNDENATDMQQMREINLSWSQKKLQKLKICKGVASQRRRLRVCMMATWSDGQHGSSTTPDVNSEEKRCLAVCYSDIFQIRSHQSQLSQETKTLRKLLVEKKRKRRNLVMSPSFTETLKGHSDLFNSESKFFITNVGKEQVQDRNFMGNEEGRYPIVHFDGRFFAKAVQPLDVRCVWLEFHLVDDSEQNNQVLIPGKVPEESPKNPQWSLYGDLLQKQLEIESNFIVVGEIQDPKKRKLNQREDPEDFDVSRFLSSYDDEFFDQLPPLTNINENSYDDWQMPLIGM